MKVPAEVFWMCTMQGQGGREGLSFGTAYSAGHSLPISCS